MANTLTGLIPTLYESLDVVSRELVGFIPAVSRNTNGERAALNETITIAATEVAAMEDNTPSVTAPNTGGQKIDPISMSITKSKHVPIQWAGEEERGMNNAGTYGNTLRDQFTQAFRALTNQIEIDLYTAAWQGASRAYGTAGTAPFGVAGDLSDIAQTRKILDDNGAPQTDLHLVCGSSAIANLRGKQNVLFKVNEAGTSDLLRKGTIGELEGMMIGNSNAVTFVNGSSAASFTTDTAGYAIGTSLVNVITGTTTISPGDIVSFAGDANKYVVSVGTTGAGPILLGGSGLRQAIAASAVAITATSAASARNIGFSRNALQLIARSPAMPKGGDMADDAIQIQDPASGIVYEIAVYRQFLQVVYHVRLAWGVKAIKADHIAALIG